MISPTPQDIISQVKRTRSWSGGIPTVYGKIFCPWDDAPSDLSIQEVSWGLAYTYRYGGQAQMSVTVAEHSVMVVSIMRNLWPDLDSKILLAGLLHDASESVLHDIQAPIRPFIQVRLPSGEVISWDESDRRVTAKIAAPFGVSLAHLDAPEVKAADMLAGSIERRDITSLPVGDWGLPPIPAQIENVICQGLNPQQARHRFMREYVALSDFIPDIPCSPPPT